MEGNDRSWIGEEEGYFSDEIQKMFCSEEATVIGS